MTAIFDPFAFRVLLIACEMFFMAILFFSQSIAEKRDMPKYRLLLLVSMFMILGAFVLNYWNLVTLFHKTAGWKY